MSFSLSPFAPENLVSRDGFGSPVPRQPAHLDTRTETGAYLRDSSRVPRGRPFILFGIDRVTDSMCNERGAAKGSINMYHIVLLTREFDYKPL